MRGARREHLDRRPSTHKTNKRRTSDTDLRLRRSRTIPLLIVRLLWPSQTFTANINVSRTVNLCRWLPMYYKTNKITCKRKCRVGLRATSVTRDDSDIRIGSVFSLSDTPRWADGPVPEQMSTPSRVIRLVVYRNRSALNDGTWWDARSAPVITRSVNSIV